MRIFNWCVKTGWKQREVEKIPKYPKKVFTLQGGGKVEVLTKGKMPISAMQID